MDQSDWLAQRFEQHRSRLTALAFRMLGSRGEADDAVQEAWLRLSRADTERDRGSRRLADHGRRPDLPELASVRQARREEPLGRHMPDPVAEAPDDADPEHEALLADSVGLALLIVLDTLTPPSGWRSCCTTCSTFRSTRSPRSSAARPAARASSPAAPAGGSAARTPAPRPTCAASGSSSTRSSRPPATATSTGCWRCSTPTWCYAPTPPRSRSAPSPRPAGPPP